MRLWKLGEVNKHYGKVVMMAYLGEPYRFFQNKDGCISMIPLATLREEEER